MEALKALIPDLIAASLFGLVFAVGLHATPQDLRYVLVRPVKLVRGILAIVVLPPIIAGIVVSLLPLSPAVKAAIVLMAISPVPPLVPGNELAIGGRKEYAYGLYVAMALLTIVSVPVVFTITSSMFGRDDAVPLSLVARIVLLGVILPLALGSLVRLIAPTFAERIWHTIYKISIVLIFGASVPLLIANFGAIMQLLGNGTLIAIALLTLSLLAIGHLLGGPDPHDRATLAIAASTRHPGIALALAGTAFDDPSVKAGILLFVLWGMIISFPYKAWIKNGSATQPGHA